MGPPGRLDELDPAGLAAWDRAVADALSEALAELGEDRQPVGLTTDLTGLSELRAPDWPAFPARIADCLSDERALLLLDWRSEGEGDLGRLRHQEEYTEWRMVREDGVLRRIELTSELSAYWEVLAGYAPERLRALVAEFAGEPEDEVEIGEIYRLSRAMPDPFAPGVTPEQRIAAFQARMVSPDVLSPYNDGQRALCCMLQGSNNLFALLALVASAARPLLVRDPVTRRPRFASGSEAIELLGASAQDGRNSDPLIVERIARLATEGRPIAFDDPVGIYMRGVQHEALAQPDGSDVPEAWFHFSRGARAAETADRRQRCQRLTLELPDDVDFTLEDLVVRRTGEPLLFGGQLAALVQLTAYVRTGPPPADPGEIEAVDIASARIGCRSVRASWQAFEDERAAAVP